MLSTDYDANSHAGMRLAALVVLLALAGCGDQRAAELESANSWSVTAVLAARHWLRGEVPSAYARRTLKRAAEELAKGPLPGAAQPVEELRAAIERRDRAEVRALLSELAGG
ncbi:MAG: hypothetical protein ABR570_05535 [Burkholderiales bacterium]